MCFDVFWWNMISTSSSVRLLLALKFMKVSGASFRRCDWKWLILIASVISGCTLGIASKKFSNSSEFPIVPSKINVFVVVGLNNADNV